MNIYTRRHFVRLARLCADLYEEVDLDTGDIDKVVWRIIRMCKLDNPDFNEKEFLLTVRDGIVDAVGMRGLGTFYLNQFDETFGPWMGM